MSRAARGANENFLEAYGSQGGLVYRLDREKPKWYVGELRAAGASGTLQPLPVKAGLPRSAAQGDLMDPHSRTARVFEFERLAHFQIDLLEKWTGHTRLKRVVDRRFVAKVEGMVGVPEEGVDEILRGGIHR